MHQFQKLATGLDVSKVMLALKAQPHLFEEITGRQDYAGSAHKDTKSILLRWCRGLDVHAAFNEIQAFDFPAMGKLQEAHELINYTIRRVGAMQLGRVLIVSLRSGGVIAPHADEGVYADYYERFHIALESENCEFRCGDESVEMKAGELWWFNHKQEHQVFNRGTTDRIHMILDCVAPQFRTMRVPYAV